jgi:4-amino-4-deoxy-L-arabinose transferase-like glycosyltransferase
MNDIPSYSEKRLAERWLFLFGLVLLTAAAIWLYFYTTPQGVGLTNDSSAYLGGARSILRGEGYVRFSGDRLPRPITQFPPLYALKIAAIAGLFNLDVFRAAWLLNLCCYVLNLLLFSLLIWRLSRSLLAGLAGGVVFLCSGPILQAHVYGLSEAFSLVFTLVRSLPFWLALGVWLGLLMLVRYAGVSVLIALIVYILAVMPGPKKKLTSAAALLAGAALPFSLWLLNPARGTENAVNRAFTFHFPNADVLNEGILTLTGYFLPEVFGILQKTILFWKIFWPILSFFRRLKREPAEFSVSQQGLFLSALLALVYLAVLLGVAFFIDGSTVLDNRMLLPFFVFASMFLILLMADWAARMPKMRLFSLIAVLVFAAFLMEDEVDLIQAFHKDGQGFVGSVWSESETALAAQELPQERTFFSNRQTYLWLMKDMPAYILPAFSDAATQQENADFQSEKEWLQRELQSGDAYAIVFNYQDLLEEQDDRLWMETLFAGMPVYGSYADGMIFGLK